MSTSSLYIVTGKMSRDAYYLINEDYAVVALLQKNVYYRIGDQIPQSAITQLYNIKPYIVFKQLLKELL